MTLLQAATTIVVRCCGAVAVAAMLLGVAATALAHPDERVVDATLRLAPGQVVSIPMAVHFHRLVATYRVHTTDASDLTLHVFGADTEPTGDVTTAGGAWRLVTRLQGEGSLHHLIDCCLGIDHAAFTLWVRNDGAEVAVLDLRAWLVHDEFAVVVQRAEAGALEVPLVAFLALGLSASMVSMRQRRLGGGGTFTRSGALPPGSLALGWSVGLFGWACSLALALGVAGAGRYGTGLIDGVIAIMADVPVPGGPFGSRAAAVMGVLLLAWMASIGLWIRAVHLGAHLRSPWPARHAMALALVSLGVGVAMGWTYGGWSVPVGLGLVLAVPLVWSATRLGHARAGGA